MEWLYCTYKSYSDMTVTLITLISQQLVILLPIISYTYLYIRWIVQHLAQFHQKYCWVPNELEWLMQQFLQLHRAHNLLNCQGKEKTVFFHAFVDSLWNQCYWDAFEVEQINICFCLHNLLLCINNILLKLVDVIKKRITAIA